MLSGFGIQPCRALIVWKIKFLSQLQKHEIGFINWQFKLQKTEGMRLVVRVTLSALCIPRNPRRTNVIIFHSMR